MLYLESPPQVTSLSTKFMHERGGVPQLDKYQIFFTETFQTTNLTAKLDAQSFTLLYILRLCTVSPARGRNRPAIQRGRVWIAGLFLQKTGAPFTATISALPVPILYLVKKNSFIIFKLFLT